MKKIEKILKNKKIIIGLGVLIVIVVLLLLFINIGNKKKIEKELIKISTNYFENELVEYMPNILKNNGTLEITLKSLKLVEKDVSFFEKKKCNLEKTYVILTYNEDKKYDIETHLDCK